MQQVRHLRRDLRLQLKLDAKSADKTIDSGERSSHKMDEGAFWVDFRKGGAAMIYGEPETPQFLAALQRLKRQQRKKERQTRQAKLRVRAALRKMRES
jgi:hypothetical protein